jgi:hypothetical protein
MADGTMGDGPSSSVLLPSAVPGPGFPLRSRPDTLCFYSLIKLVYSVVSMALAIDHGLRGPGGAERVTGVPAVQGGATALVHKTTGTRIRPHTTAGRTS